MDTKEKNKKVITRFAPSPTGLPHLGTAMYALLNYVYARQNGGEVIMRSEDTDPARSKKEYEEAIVEGLAWLGIKADTSYRQSERTELYKKYIAKMVADGTAYISREKSENGGERDLVRFKNPNKVVIFHDMSRGDISVDTTDLKDFIIARDVDSPLYHLTVVVDDYETHVTHVIRGEDGLANTPRQILIQEAIGAPRPVYAHYPFVLMPNRMKMGKRNGAVSIQDYRKQGYLPEAIVNFVILLVWHPTDDRELFTLQDLIQEFQLERIGKSGAILDQKKLNWLNREYILRQTTDEQFSIFNLQFSKTKFAHDPKIKDKKFMEKIMKIIVDHIHRWNEVSEMVDAGEFDYCFQNPEYPKEMLLSKFEQDPEKIKERLQKVLEIFSGADENNFENPDDVKKLIWDYAEEQGRGSVLWPLRVALSGLEKSPDPFTLASILGKSETVERIKKAVQILNK